MKLPKKISILDTTQSVDTRLRFDDWEGYDTKLQIKYLAYKLNEIIDYLHAAPQLPNELPTTLKREGIAVVHEHHYKLMFRLGQRGFFECPDCGEKLEKMVAGI